ncbi:hypothetical protein D6833_00200, partial [Candidatus Parcubacteria bacterium]
MGHAITEVEDVPLVALPAALLPRASALTVVAPSGRLAELPVELAVHVGEDPFGRAGASQDSSGFVGRRSEGGQPLW